MWPAVHTAAAGAVYLLILVKSENFFTCKKNNNILLDGNIELCRCTELTCVEE